MRNLRAFWIRLRGLFGNRDREADLHAELESHLQMHIEDNLRAGLTPQEARRRARSQARRRGANQQAYRERATLPWLECLCRTFAMACA